MQRKLRPVQGAGRLGLAPWIAAIALCLAPAIAAAHPTAEELAEREQRKALCSREANPGDPFDPIRLGAEEAEVRAAWGDSLETRPIEHETPAFHSFARPQSTDEPEPAPARDPYAEQLRVRRAIATGDVRRVEAELFRGRVYRIRWELAERFHVRIMDEVVHQATHCYGAPLYDQTIEAKIASGEVHRRRAGWRRGSRLLEIRQLNPLLGGPLFVTVTDVDATQEIIAARGTVAPEPERRDDPWWSRTGTPPRLPDEAERDTLVRAVAAVLSHADY